MQFNAGLTKRYLYGLIIAVGCGSAFATGCSGTVGDTGADGADDDPDRPGAGGTGDRGGAGSEVQAAGIGVNPLRRLARLEYDNVLRDLLGDKTSPAAAFPDDAEGASGFFTGTRVSLGEVRLYMTAAEAVAARAGQGLPHLLACANAANDGCASDFIKAFGLRAFRRPLIAQEAESLFAMYKAARTEGLTFDDAIAQLIETILQSPSFLYHWELGPGLTKAASPSRDVVTFSPYEMASKLSFMLWATMPDDKLFEAAARDELHTDEQLQRQAERMLKDTRAQDGLANFHRQWLKLASPYRAGDDQVRQAADAETTAFVSSIIQEGDGRLLSLLTKPAVSADPRLASIYGDGPLASNASTLRAANPEQRGGILTQVNFLRTHAAASQSHPVKRGAVIWSRILCGELPAVPANVSAPKPPAEGVSTRQRFAEHSANACARACHAILDPPGFALENFDGNGMFRAMDGGKPVDASGDFELPNGDRLAFSGFADFATGLAKSEDAGRCFALQWTRFALARGLSEEDDTAAAALALDAQSSLDIPALLSKIVVSKAFRFRRLSPGEGVQ